MARSVSTDTPGSADTPGDADTPSDAVATVAAAFPAPGAPWRALRRVPLLASVPDGALRQLWDGSVPRRAAAGEVLRRTGEPARQLPVVLRGTVAASRTTGSGRVVRYGQWAGPCALDKTAVIDGGGHSATLTALSECVLRYVPRGRVLALTDDVPGVRRHVLRTLAAQVRAGQAEFASLATLSSEARLALWLLEAADEGGHAQLPTHQALAERLGVTRVTVSRALGSLRAQGLIATGRGRVTLPAPELLALRAAGD